MIEPTTPATCLDLPATDLATPQPALKAERIQLALRDLPGWALTKDESAIERTYDCTSLDAAFHFLCYVWTSAFDRGQKPRLVIEGFRVLVCLFTASAGGVTQADLDLAHWIDRR